jgi:predicted Zn-dependent peptidase
MNQSRAHWLAMVALFCLAAGAAAAQDLASKVVERRLKNGLTVLIYPRPQAPVVAIDMRFKVGSVDEETGYTGIAHLLEHMLFKGTKSVGTRDWEAERRVMEQLDHAGAEYDAERAKGAQADPEKLKKLRAEIDRLQKEQAKYIIKDEMDQIYSTAGGVGLNASTSRDFTTYVVSLPSNKLELWMAIESDRMRNPILREFYVERDNVIEERRMRVDADPEGTLWETFFATGFTAHPYRNPVIGWESDIPLLPKSAVQSFLETYYAPNNATVAFVGDVDPEKVMRWMERYFADIPPKVLPRRSVTREPEQQVERRATVTFAAQPQLIMGYLKPAPPAREDYVLDVLDTILSQGRSSRLYRELVEEKQIATNIMTANGAGGGRYDSHFLFFGAPRHPHTATDLEAAILGVVEKIKKEPVAKQELQKARNQLRAGYIRSLNSNAGLAARLTSYQQMVGDWRYMTTYESRIATVTPEEIMEVARRYFTPGRRTVATLVPAEKEPPSSAAEEADAKK